MTTTLINFKEAASVLANFSDNIYVLHPVFIQNNQTIHLKFSAEQICSCREDSFLTLIAVRESYPMVKASLKIIFVLGSFSNQLPKLNSAQQQLVTGNNQCTPKEALVHHFCAETVVQ